MPFSRRTIRPATRPNCSASRNSLDGFVAHATNKFGGLYVEVNENLWPRPQVGDVGLVPQHKAFFETLDFEPGELAHRKQRKTGFDQT
jgi:hypothetical protein